jgi:hypothetical protein
VSALNVGKTKHISSYGMSGQEHRITWKIVRKQRLRGISGPARDEVTAAWRKLQS